MITTTHASNAPDLAEVRDAAGPRRIGLALSGGGFRASLFHIGVLARLAEIDLLRQVDVLSCVSGGSIIGALYYLYLKRELDAHGEIESPRLIEIVAEMEQHFLSVVQTNLRWRIHADLLGNLRLARSDYSSADRLGELLDRHLYRPVWGGDPERPVEMRMLEINPRGQRDFNPITDNVTRHCKAPVLMINAATLNTGHAWRFGVDRVGEPPHSAARRQVDRNLLLGQSRYNGLAHDYADMALGKAVAASAAFPDRLAPLPLHRLYPHPEKPKRRLCAELADGALHDSLGADVLIERGCTHVIASDGASPLPDDLEPERRGVSSLRRSRDLLMERVRELQIARLSEKRPRHVMLLHMMREAAAPELKPIGPADQGHVITDRAETEVTSFGVQRRVQGLLARMRTDLDAFSDAEAFALMADGYLLTRRSFDELDQQGEPWTEGPAFPFKTWRFAAMFDVLRQPPDGLIRRLEVGRHRWLKGQRLVMRLRFETGLLLAACLGLLWMAAAWAPDRPALDAAALTAVEIALVLAIIAYPGLQALRSAAEGAGMLSWLKRPLALVNWASAIVAALPLTLFARLQLYAGRLFLKAGDLTRIGVEPPSPSIRPLAAGKVRGGGKQPDQSKKAA